MAPATGGKGKTRRRNGCVGLVGAEDVVLAVTIGAYGSVAKAGGNRSAMHAPLVLSKYSGVTRTTRRRHISPINFRGGVAGSQDEVIAVAIGADGRLRLSLAHRASVHAQLIGLERTGDRNVIACH